MNAWKLLLLVIVFVAAGCREGQREASEARATHSPALAVTAPAREGGTEEVPATPPVPEATPEATEPPSFVGTVPAPEFPSGLDWLNVDGPLSLADLRGKIVLLDFWTYGCINCMHVIPDLKRLEEKYAEELVVVGVHSAKFDNEGETENIRRIVQRYELAHPVVNDENFAIWNTYGVRAWPTFVLIDPRGNVVGYESGEGIYELFDFVIAAMIDEFQEEIDRTPFSFVLEKERLANKPLLFPGKIVADAEGGRLFIADSNHNRIVIADLEGKVTEVVGSGLAGAADGDFVSAQFFRPQGLALADNNTLYVADTANHLIRRVDLVGRTVTTVAGTGEQVYSRIDEGGATDTPLNSPWDVLYRDGLLYIAMAGQHQLWFYDPATEKVGVFAGSGREELSDGTRVQAGFNQPSGLAADGEWLYVADSEASAIRAVALANESEAVKTLVGTGLFDFGDMDGTGDAVRLQHPLGLTIVGETLYIADTYNDKIKILDPNTREVRTFLGTQAGWRDGDNPLFDEPGGLSVADNRLYVADTNNHVVRVIDLTTGTAETLVLVDEQGLLTRAPEGSYGGRIVTLEPQRVGAGEGEVRLEIAIPDGYKLNDVAPFSMAWESDGTAIDLEEGVATQTIVNPAFPLALPASFVEGETTLRGDLVIYYCEAEAQALCLIEQVRLVVPVTIGPEEDATLNVVYAVPAP